jgi:hypothetical protein
MVARSYVSPLVTLAVDVDGDAFKDLLAYGVPTAAVVWYETTAAGFVATLVGTAGVYLKGVTGQAVFAGYC